MQKYKKIILINLFTFFLLIGIPISTIFISYQFLFPEGFFFEDKYFRSIHMRSTLKDKDIDIIFIGSSHTQSHISSKIFKDAGYEAYTYGRPAMELSDFPLAVKKSMEIKPKYIYLMITINDLYSPIFLKYPTYEDRVFYNKDFSYTTYNEYLSDKFRVKDLFRESKKFLVNKYKDNHSKYLNSYDRNETNKIDCNIIHWRGKIGKRSAALCSNGNTIAFDNQTVTINKSIKKYFIDKVNQEKILLLNRFISEIKDRGITPIVVFEPSSIHTFNQYSYEDFEKIINANILHLSNFNIQNNRLWTDQSHFNIHGRNKYTNELIEKTNTIYLNAL